MPQAGQLRLALANASLYLEMMGHLLVGWMWLRQAIVASRALPGAAEIDRDFYRGKLQACQYFFRYELPLVHSHAKLLQSLDSTTIDTDSSWF
jgi:hypothetical protein